MPTPVVQSQIARSSRLSLAATFALTALAGCTYDLDKIYGHTKNDAGIDEADAADGSSADEVPEQLIDLYEAHSFIDEDCRACVVKNCKPQNTSCRADEECVAATRCFGEAIDPDSHAQCRAEHLDWFGEDLDARVLGGPFYLCALRDKCKSECSTPTDWSCLREFTWSETSEKSVSLGLKLFDAKAGDIGSDITIKVCAAEDVDCETPAVKDTFLTDKNGYVDLTLPTPLRAFRGYFDLTGKGWFPTIVHFSSPITRDGVQALGIINEVNVGLSVGAVGVSPDKTRGLLQIRMFGCAGIGMSGVSFSASLADEQSVTWYWDGSRPRLDVSETTEIGNGGIVNVPVGLNEIVAKLGDEVVARTTVPVRANHMTIVVLSPLGKGN